MAAVQAALNSGFTVPDWLAEFSRNAEQRGWLLERDAPSEAIMALRFFRPGRCNTVICESNGRVKAIDWRGRATPLWKLKEIFGFL